jgi:uncharacterized membrane protein YqiK
MSDDNGKWIVSSIFISVILVLGILVIIILVMKNRSVVFERDAEGRITGIHYV